MLHGHVFVMPLFLKSEISVSSHLLLFTAQFVSDLGRDPLDRFCPDMAYNYDFRLALFSNFAVRCDFSTISKCDILNVVTAEHYGFENLID